MESHIKVLAILNIVSASLGVIAALVVLLAMGGVAGIVAMDHDSDAATVAPMLGGIGVVVSSFILVVSLPGLIGGIGLLKMAPWSRIVVIIVSALNLISFPFGTALGIYGIWVLTRPEVEAQLTNNLPAGLASAR